MSSEIKAAFYKGNKNFKIKNVESIAPNKAEVQIRIAFCGICGTDMHVFHGRMDERIGHDRVIGHEMSGVVSEIGEEVNNIVVGDHVVVRPLDNCGACPACDTGHTHICHNLKFLGLDTNGAFQQLWTVPSHTVHKLPKDLDLAHAALIEPVAVACHGVSRGKLKKGENAFVIGGGPIGMLTAMVAKQEGANVIISEVSEVRLAIAKKLGFKTINPLEQNVVEEVMKFTNNKGADVVIEASGSKPAMSAITEVAACRGRIVMTAIHANKPEIDMFKFFWRELELFGARVYTAADFEKAIKLIHNGSIDVKSIITDISSLDNIQESFEALDGNPLAMKSLISMNTSFIQGGKNA